MTTHNDHFARQWLQRTYAERLGVRRPTMERALELMHDRHGRRIVETGCARREGNWAGDGCSTIVWAHWAAATDGYVVSVDIDERHVLLAQSLTAQFAHWREVNCADSVEWLRFNGSGAMPTAIDLLYLDSVDFVKTSAHVSQDHALAEYVAASDQLAADAIVVVDDCDLPHGGKGGKVVPYMCDNGWRIEMQEYQTVLVRR